MGKKTPIGVSDFKELIDDDRYYVDKSLFIKEVVEHSSDLCQGSHNADKGRTKRLFPKTMTSFPR